MIVFLMCLYRYSISDNYNIMIAFLLWITHTKNFDILTYSTNCIKYIFMCKFLFSFFNKFIHLMLLFNQWKIILFSFWCFIFPCILAVFVIFTSYPWKNIFLTETAYFHVFPVILSFSAGKFYCISYSFHFKLTS